MNFEKIEEAYTLLLENVQVIQNKLILKTIMTNPLFILTSKMNLN